MILSYLNLVLFIKLSVFTNKCKYSYFQLVQARSCLLHSLLLSISQAVAMTELVQPLLFQLSVSVATCGPISSLAYFGRDWEYFAKIQGSLWKSIIFLTNSWHFWETKASIGPSRPNIHSFRTRDNLKLGPSELGIFFYYSVIRKERNYQVCTVLGRKECVKYLSFVLKGITPEFSLHRKAIYFLFIFPLDLKNMKYEFVIE